MPKKPAVAIPEPEVVADADLSALKSALEVLDLVAPAEAEEDVAKEGQEAEEGSEKGESMG